MNSSPFLLNAKSTGLPTPTETNFDDKDIVEYGVVQKIKKLGEKDTDFIIEDVVVETNRFNRQEYINSFRNDVGILNIIEKVRLSGDATLLMQNQRACLGASGEKDSLGRDLEPVVDVMDYQVDTIDAFETVKKARQAGTNGLPDDLTKGLSFDGVANLSDDEIDTYFAGLAAKAKAAKAKEKEGE